MSYTDEAINTVISDLVPQSGPANIIGLMLKQLLAERDELKAQLAGYEAMMAHRHQVMEELEKVRQDGREQIGHWMAEHAKCEMERDAALARVVQLEGALRFYADVNNWFLEKTYTGASQICIRGNDRSDVDQGDEVYTCGGKRARAALSQSPSEALAAVRAAQGELRGIYNWYQHKFKRPEDEKSRHIVAVMADHALKALNDAFGEGEEE